MSRTFFLHYPSNFVLFHCAFILPCIFAKPTPLTGNYYETSIKYLLANECEMPKEVFIPFPLNYSDPDRFSYLSTPLKECQTDEAVKENEEAHVLCKDIFKVLKDITCDKYNVSLPNIKSSLPSDACSSFFEMRDVVPKQEEYLVGRLIDRVVCNLICKDKYDTLCKTLAWSYDVLTQIESALENKVMYGEKGNVSGIKDTTDKKENEILTELQPYIAKTNTENNLNAGTNVQMKGKMKNPLNEVNTNNVDIAATVITKTIAPVTRISSNKNATDLSNTNMESGAIISTNDENSSITTKVTDEQNMQGQINRQLDPNSNNNDKDINQEENTNDNVQPKEPNLNDNSVDIDSGKNYVNISGNSKNTDESDQNNNQNKLSGSISQTDDKNKDITSNNNIETTVKSGNSISSKIPLDNELNTGDFQEQESENKMKEKPISSKTKNTEKFKDADSGIPNAVTSDAVELTTLQVPLDKDDENDQPEDDKDQEQYHDTENESDYSKAEFENTFNQPSKDKDFEVKNTASAADDLANGIANNYESYSNPRNSHEHDGIRIVSTFPEQEDSHFFFYFLSIVFILMAGYLIFHNKQKIIALIVEGRHERRRRSHGAGYKKLETK